MFIKRFSADSLEKALSRVREELGPDALILSTLQKRRGWRKSGIEVVAAYEPKPEQSDFQWDEESLTEIFPHRREKSSEKRHPVGERRGGPGESTQSVITQERFLQLGFSQSSAAALCSRMGNEKSTGSPRPTLIVEGIRTLSLGDLSSQSWMAIGVAGCGKTSLLVKLALILKRARFKVSLSSLDRRKLLGQTELMNFAKLIGVPFGRSASLIDGPSVTLAPCDQDDEILRGSKDHGVLLVLDSTWRLEELMRVVNYCRRFSPRAVAFTRCDLASQFGVFYDVLKGSELGLLGASFSQSFTLPFQFLTSDKLAGLILNRGMAKEVRV